MRHKYEIKAEAGVRLCSLNTIAKINKSLLITEFPKSGGTWLGNMLSDLYNTDFPRNRLFNPLTKKIYHGHYLRCIPSRTVTILRDPRDVIVSLFHHIVVGNSKVHPSLVNNTRKKLNIADAGITNFDNELIYNEFIQLLWSKDTPIKINMNNFLNFAMLSCINKASISTKYEYLIQNPSQELQKISSFLSIDVSDSRISNVIASNSKENMKVQQKEGSFLRKGIVGDWKNHLSSSNIQLLKSCLTDAENALNYFSLKF